MLHFFHARMHDLGNTSHKNRGITESYFCLLNSREIPIVIPRLDILQGDPKKMVHKL